MRTQHDIVNLKSAVDTIPKLQQDIANINAELERSNTAQVSSALNSANMETIIYKAQKCLLRSRNLLFFNAHDTNNITTDQAIIIDLLKNILVDARNLSISRIGNPLNNKIRPTVVTFSNNQDPHLNMKNREKIPGKTIIGFDKTKSQQAQYKKVSASLKTRLNNGEKDLTIRYIKGTPTIVPAGQSILNQHQNSQSSASNFP
ncbi:hypothetical protein QAD02_012586 [Eretmocerus hayati]|uniref:Uncharacterized protein n=1 Tax=Eretmocerus hayati TaxID=131215 RepID=A0ACC2P0E5_9HYME|nr:hypothetical protein QAD02_012586 [Eretmocerus hayati]